MSLRGRHGGSDPAAEAAASRRPEPDLGPEAPPRTPPSDELREGEPDPERPLSPALRLGLVTLTLSLVLAVVGLPSPGLPAALKTDEPAYYLMARSLWHDRDLRCEEAVDLRRLFREFPGRTENLVLMSPDGWRTVYFGSPFVYAALAAPFVGLLGANGMLALNALLFAAMIWMGTTWLRRFNGDGRALLFAVAFFFLSAAFSYVFWLQPETFVMAAVTFACWALYQGLRHLRPGRAGVRELAWTCASAAALAAAGYNKPPTLLIGVALVVFLWRRSGLGLAAAWGAAALVALLGMGGLSLALTGEPWPASGPIKTRAPRTDLGVSSPIEWIERNAPRELESKSRGLGEELRPVPPSPGQFLENLGYFLWGRHVGVVAYVPFALLSVLLPAFDDRRRGQRWLLAATVFGSALVYMLYMQTNWFGPRGFIGNRYLVIVYPALIFVVTAVRPLWLVAATSGWAALFVGPLLLTPFGAPVDSPTLQAHTRGIAFQRLPFEVGLASKFPGYTFIYHSGATFLGRDDQVVDHGAELWLRGATSVESWVFTEEPLADAAFEVRSLAPGNEVDLCLAGDCAELRFDAPPPRGESIPVTLRPRSPGWRSRGDAPRRLGYRLDVRTTRGEQPRWRGSGPEDFYLGVALVYLGSEAERRRDLYGAVWEKVMAPARVRPGQRLEIPVRVRNASGESWPASGATRVLASYHWFGEAGERVIWDGLRSPLARPVAPGESVDVVLTVAAPPSPGTYALELDLVRERLDWFSTRSPDSAHRLIVEVAEPR